MNNPRTDTSARQGSIRNPKGATKRGKSSSQECTILRVSSKMARHRLDSRAISFCLEDKTYFFLVVVEEPVVV